MLGLILKRDGWKMVLPVARRGCAVLDEAAFTASCLTD
jgi:hypothetical protein